MKSIVDLTYGYYNWRSTLGVSNNYAYLLLHIIVKSRINERTKFFISTKLFKNKLDEAWINLI